MTESAVRVLIVEDSVVAARLAQLELSQHRSDFQFEFDHSRTVREALTRISEGSIDVILLDLGLPDSDGIETVKRVHSAKPEIPIVVFTSTESDPLALAALQVGAQDFVVKGQIAGRDFARTVVYAVERKRLEAERDAARAREAEMNHRRDIDEARREIINGAAHALGTPLTPMRLQVHLLRSGALGEFTEKQKHAVDVLERNIARLERLAHNIVNASLLESSPADYDFVSFDASRFLTDIAADYAHHGASGGARVECKVDPDLVLVGDRDRLRRVVECFISNAVINGRRHGHILLNGTRSGDKIVVTISDDGPGFTPEDAARVFDAFQTSHGSPREPLGDLAAKVAKRVVEQHGGTISYESEGIAGGVTCTIRLPAPKPETDMHVAATSAPK